MANAERIYRMPELLKVTTATQLLKVSKHAEHTLQHLGEDEAGNASTARVFVKPVYGSYPSEGVVPTQDPATDTAAGDQVVVVERGFPVVLPAGIGYFWFRTKSGESMVQIIPGPQSGQKVL